MPDTTSYMHTDDTVTISNTDRYISLYPPGTDDAYS